VAITVVAGETVVQVFEAEYVALLGETIEVTAQAEGQMKAINEQLASNTIKSVVSKDRIQDVPDVNAAESVSRLPGVSIIRSGGEGQKVTIRGLSPKYNVMMVNGVRMQSTDRNDRSVDLNMIASNMLTGIEVTKALTADMDADAVGGTVDLMIGKAAEGFRGDMSLQIGHGSLDNTYGNHRINAWLSNRFLDNKLGVRISGSYDNFDRSSDVISAGWDINRSFAEDRGFILSELNNVTITDRITDRKRIGGGLILDYQLPDGSLVLQNFISRLDEEQSVISNTATTSSSFSASASLNEVNNTVYNNALQGEFEFFNIDMDFSLSNSVSKQHHPGSQTMTIYPGTGGGGVIIPQELLDERDENNIPLVKRLEPNEFLNAITLGQDLRTNRFSTLKRDVTETAQEARLNFNVPYTFTSWLSGDLQFGGRYIHTTRENDETQNYVSQRTEIFIEYMELLRDSLWTDAGFTQDDGNVGIRAHLFENKDYDIGDDFLSGQEGVSKFFFLPDFDQMKKLINLAENNMVTTTRYGYGPAYPLDEQPSAQYDYNYSRDFGAFYIQTVLNIGKYVTLFPGVRYEGFKMDYEAYYTIRTGPQPNDFRSNLINADSISAIQGDNWFPQIHLRIKPLDWLDVRLASTKSIIYPDYRAVSPYRYYNPIGSPPTLFIANPFLKPAITQNYDVYASVYDNHIGLFTAGYFYKEVDDLIVATSLLTRDPADINNMFPISTTQNTDIDTWVNIEETSYIRGIELDWQTHFWYLPSFLRGLVLNINYTHITSETSYPYQTLVRIGTGFPPRFEQVDTTRTGRMPDQPNDILNLTLGYDIGGFSARLSFVYQDDVITGVNRTWEELDVYTAAFRRWDFTAYQRLPWGENLQVYLNLNNITDQPDRRVVSTLSKLSTVEYYGLTGDLGVRYSF
jgi:TonB-dependent receptor